MKEDKKQTWVDMLKPEELPGDLQLVAEACGMDVAIRLAENLNSMQLYISSIDRLISKKKQEYIIENFTGSNHKQLALETRYSLKWVYKILAQDNINSSQLDITDYLKAK